MRKLTKRILTGGLLFAAVSGIFIYAHRPVRMPTLPTPPGVEVPDGMRYVGGDEFDAPAGAPPTKDWQFLTSEADTGVLAGAYSGSAASALEKATILLVPATTIHDGALHLRLAGATRPGNPAILRMVMTRGEMPVTFTHSGRIELRVKMLGKTPGTGCFGISRDHKTVRLMDFGAGLSHVAGPGVNEPAQLYRHPDGNDGDYHRYLIEWSPGSVRFSQDGKVIGTENAGRPGSPFMTPVLPETWRRKAAIPALERWKKWDLDEGSRTLVFTLSAWGAADSEPEAWVDVDYIRIFQE